MLKTNVSQVQQRFLRRAATLGIEQEREARNIARVLGETSREILDRQIYAVPIPRTPSGRLMWLRTRDLRNHERARSRGELVWLENTSTHALARYQLGLPGHRAPVYTFSVQWQRAAMLSRRSWLVERRRQATLRALRAK